MLLFLSTLAHAADTDLDRVDDARDRCTWEDDSVDLDRNRVPDCAESVLAEFGFADAASTAAFWMDTFGVAAAWSAADASGYAASDTYDSTHRLVVQEFTDTSCARYLRSTTVASGYRAAGVPSLTLRGTYRTSALGVRAVMLVATSDHHGVNGVSWFDNVSFHP